MGPQARNAQTGWNLLPRIVAGLALVWIVALNLHLAGAPTFTNDFWFHLKMGEVYAHEGLWPEGDPMLHTAHADAPVQHEWLFGVAIYAWERAFGFQGIRVLHFLAVAGILALAFTILRRTAQCFTVACAGTVLFAALSWTRLFQLRPDLVSIPAALGLYVLLLRRDRKPGLRDVGLATLLALVWANCHSLFALGPALLVAALLGGVLQVILDTTLLPREARGPARQQSVASARPVAIALVAGLAASLINPRGIEQLLTFFSSSRDSAIWNVKDEWSHFDPFTIANNPSTVGPLLFWLVNILIVAFLLASLVSLFAAVRRGRATRATFDPVLFGLGLASIVALLVSVRFFWMAFFAILFVADALGRAQRAHSAQIARGIRVGVAVATLTVAFAFEATSGYRAVAQRLPNTLDAYFRTAYMSRKFHVEGVRFLRESQVTGNLFNSYPMGGFLGYWLAPELRTFIDSRTEHYPPDVLEDHARISRLKDLRSGTSYLDILDQRRVDFFFGVGIPSDRAGRAQGIYTSEHLARIPGWVLVSRSLRHAIYLRDLPRNRENFERIARGYARAGIPFDRENGFSVAEVVLNHPEWAEAHGLLTPLLARRIRDGRNAAKGSDVNALESLALVFALTGEYALVLETEAELEARFPDRSSPTSLRRQIYAALRLDDSETAIRAAQKLARLLPGDLEARQFVETTNRYREISRRSATSMRSLERQVLLDRFIHPIAMIPSTDAGLVFHGAREDPVRREGATFDGS